MSYVRDESLRCVREIKDDPYMNFKVTTDDDSDRYHQDKGKAIKR